MTFDRLSESDGTTDTSIQARTAGISRRSPMKSNAALQPEFGSLPLKFRAQRAIADQQKFHIGKSCYQSRRCPKKPALILVTCIHPGDHSYSKDTLATLQSRHDTPQTPPAASHCQSPPTFAAANQLPPGDPRLARELHTTLSHQRNISNCARNLRRSKKIPELAMTADHRNSGQFRRRNQR